MSDLANRIRMNRDRASGIVKTVFAMEGNLSLCGDRSSEEFVRRILESTFRNAGALQLWLNEYLDERSDEFLEVLQIGSVSRSLDSPCPPVNWELMHDWCVPYGRRYIMDCRDAVESVIELVDAPDEISLKGWDHLATCLKDERFAFVKEIARELRSRSANWIGQHADGSLSQAIHREAAAGLSLVTTAANATAVASDDVLSTHPFEIMHEKMKAKKATDMEVAEAFLDSRATEDKNSLLQKHDGSRHEAIKALARKCQNLRAKRRKHSKTSQ